MKTKFYTLLVVIIISISSAWGQWSGQGLGTEEEPFLITDENDLKTLAADVNNRIAYTGMYFKLTIDITLTDDWIPIGIHASNSHDIKSFNGIFDGDNHTISGFEEIISYEDIGIFGSVGDYSNSGVIKNLKVEGEISGINSGEDIGLLVGVLQNGTIDNCSSAGTIYANNGDNTGGLVGRNYGTISNSSTTCIITSNDNNFSAGGLAGRNYGEINDCHTSGSISTEGSNYYIGGLVGRNLNTGSIINCSANVAVSSENASNYVGGLVGMNDNSGTIEGCFAYGNISSTGSSCHVGGLVGGNLSIISVSYASGDIGVTDGASSNVGGLVGYNKGGTIKKSDATGPVTTDNASSYRVGGLVGKNDNTTSLIENCFASGPVTTFGNDSYIGGLVGSTQSKIDICSAIGNVTASGNGCRAGGLVGYQENGEVTNSFATGIVSANADACRAGGLVGYSRNKISYCYATGATSANEDSYIGGLVGYSMNEINDSYATGNFTLTCTYGGRAGGLVGYGNNSCIIRNSYSIGISSAVGGGSSLYIGNLIGDISSSATVTDCYAKNSSTSNIGRGGGGFTVTDIDDASDGLLGTTRNVLVDNFWGVSEGNYPYLKALRKHEVTYTDALNDPTTINYGVCALQISNITRTGYNALSLTDEWYDAATGGTIVMFPMLVTQDSALFAIWTANSYTITLNADGGTVSRNNIDVDYDAEIGEIPDPTRDGFAFDGWYHNDTKYTATTVYKESTGITLQARWTQLKEASIVSQPQGGGDYCAGDDIMMTVTASGTGLKYQWYKDGSAIKDATSEDYYITKAKNSHSGVYSVEVQANIGKPVMSNEVVIKVTDPPAIITDLALNATFSATAILNIIATGDNLTYKWYRNGKEIPGAVSDNIQVREEGSYYVAVTGDCGQINSHTCNVIFEYVSIIINRKVTLLQTEGVVTNPNAGVYYVDSRNDFVFEMWAQAGYNLDNVKVTTDKGFDVIVEPAESATTDAPRLRVSVKRINTTTTITIEGAVESNSQVGEAPVQESQSKTWSYNGKAYFNLAERTEVSIFTTTGLLYSKQTLPTGITAIELPKGIYIIQITNENTTKVIIK